MNQNRTDDEQLEGLKQWWRENGRALLVGVGLAVALVLGWDGWQKHQRETRQAASIVYQDLLDTVTQDEKAAPLDSVALTTAQNLAESLKSEYGSLVYADYAAMILARLAVQDDRLDDAARQLQWVLDHSDEATLVDLARYRLAKVRFGQGQPEDALAQLSSLNDSYLAGLAAELRGDILLAGDDRAGAREAYEAAIAALEAREQPPGRYLTMKMQSLTEAGDTAFVPLAEAPAASADDAGTPAESG